ncbi:MAG: hypothetical protein PVH19_10580 [Planctomycetia bacterium]|jgi:Leucine-rich repeat (LRR) protein
MKPKSETFFLSLSIAVLLLVIATGCRPPKDQNNSPNPKKEALDQAAIAKGVATIEKLGGKIQKTDANGNPVVVDLMQCPTTNKDVADIAGVSTIKKLVLWGSNLKDPAADSLITMPNLVDLTLFTTDLTDTGIAKLAKMKNLRHLTLRQAAYMSDKGVSALKDLENLETLSLMYNNISNDAIKSLTKMPKLKLLDLRGCNYINDEGIGYAVQIPNLAVLKHRLGVSNDGLEKIAKAKKLKVLVLQDCNSIDDDGLAVLANHATLEEVDLPRLNISDDCLTYLATIPNLRFLGLRRAFISGDGLETLAEGPAGKSIEKLNLSETDLDAEGVAVLAEFPNLKWVNLSHNNSVGDEAIAELSKLKGLECLVLSNADVSDEGLESLAELTNLKELHVDSTRVSDEGVKKLQEKLPNCKIKK